MKQSEKGLVQENWSPDGEWIYCKHNDCPFYVRRRGKKRRLLARFYPDRVQFKCDSCGQISTFKFDKKANFKTNIDEPKWVKLESLIEEWEKAK